MSPSSRALQDKAAFRKGGLSPQLINVDGVGGRGSQDEKRQCGEDYRKVQVA